MLQGWRCGMAPDEEHPEIDADPRESPFELPPIDCLPSADDAEKAHAIRRVIWQAERERASSSRALDRPSAPIETVVSEEPLGG
jgi:hypothetical protein